MRAEIPAAGGFVGAFLFPILLGWHGLIAAGASVAIASLIGILVTVFVLPETKGMSLESLSPDRTEDSVWATKRTLAQR